MDWYGQVLLGQSKTISAYESGHSGGGLPAGFSGVRLRGGKKTGTLEDPMEFLVKTMEIPINIHFCQ
jgi:hypothetical protein